MKDGNKPVPIKRWRTAHKSEGWFYVNRHMVTVVVKAEDGKIYMADIPTRSIVARKETKP